MIRDWIRSAVEGDDEDEFRYPADEDDPRDEWIIEKRGDGKEIVTLCDTENRRAWIRSDTLSTGLAPGEVACREVLDDEGWPR